MRCLSLGVMANKLVSTKLLSFFFSALKVLVSLHLFHWPFKLCSFSEFFFNFSFLVFPKVHYSSRPTCVAPPLSHHPCSYDLPWTCRPAIFVFPNVCMCQPCNCPDAFLLYCLQVTQPVLGSQQIFSIYMSPQLLSFFLFPVHHSIHSNTCPFYSAAKLCVTLQPHGL